MGCVNTKHQNQSTNNLSVNPDDTNDIQSITTLNNNKIIKRNVINNNKKIPLFNRSLEVKKAYELNKVDQVDWEQGLQGAIRQQNNYSAIMIYNSKVFIQFTLPKCKAGPLIVPMVNYCTYCL